MNLFPKRRFYRPFFVLLSLLLIGSQQAAFAHLLTHLREPAAVTHYQNDHGVIDRLADTCTTCIAFAGVSGSAPPSSFSASFTSHTSNSYDLSAYTPIFERMVMVRRARDPPAARSL